MKMISCAVVILGVVAMLLAVADRVSGHHIATVTAAGYLRGAMTLYLLALAVMIHDKVYGAKPPA
jgi:hypothetical protein